jgi:hypothetical protein
MWFVHTCWTNSATTFALIRLYDSHTWLQELNLWSRLGGGKSGPTPNLSFVRKRCFLRPKSPSRVKKDREMVDAKEWMVASQRPNMRASPFSRRCNVNNDLLVAEEGEGVSLL